MPQQQIVLGGAGANGMVSVHGKDDQPVVELLGRDGESVIGAGQQGRPGRLTLYGASRQQTVNLTADTARLELGGGDTPGAVSVRGGDDAPQVELLALPNESVLGAGQEGRPGRLTMYDAAQRPTVRLTASDARLQLGGAGANGAVSVVGADDQPLVELVGRDGEAVIGLGQTKRPGRITLYDGAGNGAVELSGASGDIMLFNADCAEEFDVAEEVAPGTVLVLGADGTVHPCDGPYDTRVVGVASGAGGYQPGLVLDRRSTGRPRQPVALMGKVYCLVDASRVPVRVGDLLTTAECRGHAMRAIDAPRAFGAVLGKALGALEGGTGLVAVLVTLQ